MKTGESPLNSIRDVLTNNPPKRLSSEILKHSAVLILIINNPSSYSLVLTERTRNMKHHSGEISFPGGRHDPTIDMNMNATALRECEEEIGISRNSIEIIGQLDDVPTMTGYIITPVVGISKDSNPKLTRSQTEVEQIFIIPIEFFLNPQSFREQSMQVLGNKFPIFMFDYYSQSKLYTIWGATAHILVEYLKKIHQYYPSKLADLKRYSMEKIEEIVKERSIKSFAVTRKSQIEKIMNQKEDKESES